MPPVACLLQDGPCRNQSSTIGMLPCEAGFPQVGSQVFTRFFPGFSLHGLRNVAGGFISNSQSTREGRVTRWGTFEGAGSTCALVQIGGQRHSAAYNFCGAG